MSDADQDLLNVFVVKLNQDDADALRAWAAANGLSPEAAILFALGSELRRVLRDAWGAR